jgi:hypothetical protein
MRALIWTAASTKKQMDEKDPKLSLPLEDGPSLFDTAEPEGLSGQLPFLEREIADLDQAIRIRQLPDYQVNQLLKRLMAHRRFVARNGLIVGTADMPPHKRQ